MPDKEKNGIDPHASGEPQLAKRQFLKRSSHLTALSVATWYSAPALEVLLTSSAAKAQDSGCPPDLCAPDAFNTCTPVFG